MTALDWLRLVPDAVAVGAQVAGLVVDAIRSPADTRSELIRCRDNIRRRHEELLEYAERQKQRRPRR